MSPKFHVPIKFQAPSGLRWCWACLNPLCCYCPLSQSLISNDGFTPTSPCTKDPAMAMQFAHTMSSLRFLCWIGTWAIFSRYISRKSMEALVQAISALSSLSFIQQHQRLGRACLCCVPITMQPLAYCKGLLGSEARLGLRCTYMYINSVGGTNWCTEVGNE